MIIQAPTHTPQEITLKEKLMQLDLVNEALGQLRGNLSDQYYYHDLQHTLNVINAAVGLGELARLPERDIELLTIAAAWHDTGFIYRRERNEEIGANLARQAMERSGRYSNVEIADVISAIRDTEVIFQEATCSMIQIASGRLSPWLLDADLSHFGGPRLLPSSLKLLREFTGLNVLAPEDLTNPKAVSFIAGTIRMLGAHKFQSQEAHTIFNAQKLENLRLFSNLLANAIGGSERSLRSAWEAVI